MRINKILYLLVVSSFWCCSVFSQTTTFNDNADFSTSNQSMWSNGAGFSLDKNIPLLNQNFGTGINLGGITNVSGFGSFGLSLEAGVWGNVGSRFYIKDLTGGLVSVDYPIRTTITYPSINTINRGEWITINTDYVVRNGWKLETVFPSIGTTALEFDFGLQVKFKPRICAFSCLPVPQIDVASNIHMDIFKLSVNELIYPSVTLLGTCPLPGFGYCPNTTPCSGYSCQPTLVRKMGLPQPIPDNGLGLSGFVDAPHVNTTDFLQPSKCLTATGSYQYFETNLDVLKFMSRYVSPPAGPILGNLSNSFGIGPATISYNLLSASLRVTNTTYQDFSFCPTIKSNFHFKTPVFYEEVTPAGVIVNSAQDSAISIATGNNLRIKYPCNFEYLDVDLDYDLENRFSNHTRERIAFSFLIEALGFSLSIADINVFPPIRIDPCGGAFGGCAFTIPGLTIPGFTLQPSPNPLISIPIPLAGIPYDWTNRTWELQGFTNKPGSSFTLDAMPYLVNSTNEAIKCNGDTSGIMEATITNGVSPFNFFWSNGDITSSATQLGINNNLVAGPNAVIVEDFNGCQVTTSQLIIEPSQKLKSFNSTITNVVCNGEASGEIEVSMTGGTTPYSYSWSSSSSVTNLSQNLTVGTYNLEVTDSNNCIFLDTFEITEPNLLTASVLIENNVSCNGGNDGSASIIVSGGSFPYTFLWSTGDTTQNLKNLPEGNHTCTVTDLNGCDTTIFILITEPVLPIALSITQDSALCYKDSSGIIDLTVTGGTIPYSYDWYNSSIQLLSIHTQDLSNLPSDRYLAFVTDTNGCFDSISIFVEHPDTLKLDTFSTTDVLCYGFNTGEINISPIGGSTPYFYSWSNGGVSQDLTSIIADTYDLNLTDRNGCKYLDTFFIEQPNDSIFATSINNNILCYGFNTGKIDATIIGGTTPYSLSWSNGETSEDIDSLVAGNYSLTITDSSNCVLVFDTIITQPLAPLDLILSFDSLSCYDSSNGQLFANVTGGTSPYYYQWNNSAEVILADTTFNPQNLNSDLYHVFIHDTNNCIIQDSILLAQPDSLKLSYSAIDVLCKENSTGAIDISIIGGSTPYSYLWSNGDVSEDLSNIPAGIYTLYLSDNMNCKKEYIINIEEPDEILTAEVQKKDLACNEKATGVAIVNIFGGVPQYSILWSNGDTNRIADTLLSGNYTVTVQDMNGCSANSGTVISQPSNLSFTHSIIDASCFNFYDGEIEIFPTGGITPYSIIFGDTLTNSFNNTSNQSSVDSLHAGVYYARVIDKNGCEYEELIEINQPDSLMVSGISTDTKCYGSSDGNVNISVTGGTKPYSYLWSNADVNQNLIGVSSDWYFVEVMDDHNCLTPDTFFVDQPPEIIFSNEVSQTTCRDNADGTISIFVEGGIPDYSYLWSNNEVTESIYNLAPGQYSIIISDMNGCIKTDTFNLNESEIDCIQPPTAFTPDADGINDTWILKNINNYKKATVQVYNEWGNLLYETKGNYSPWKGTYNNKPLPAATYYYIIDLNNGNPPYSGPVTIVMIK